MPLRPLLTVFGFLTSRAATVGTSDIFLFLRLRLDFIIILARSTTSSEGDTILKNQAEIVFLAHINDGTILFL